jgi:hypothetical protein
MPASSAPRIRYWAVVGTGQLVFFGALPALAAPRGLVTLAPSTETAPTAISGQGESPAVALSTRTEPDVVATCVADHAAGQEARLQSRLLDAARLFTQCSQPQCPQLVREDCEPWLAEVDAHLPRVVIELQAGVNAADVRLFIDGERSPLGLGESRGFDPGRHNFRFEAPGRATRHEDVVLFAGEAPRRILVAFEAPPARHAPHEPESRAPVRELDGEGVQWSWLLGGVGAVGVGVAAYFGVASLDERARLRRTCAPLCSSAQVQTLRQRAVIADVGLGVGILGAGLATFVHLMRGHGASSDARVSADAFAGVQLSLEPSFVSVAMEERF